jgi:hypothetical protein
MTFAYVGALSKLFRVRPFQGTGDSGMTDLGSTIPELPNIYICEWRNINIPLYDQVPENTRLTEFKQNKKMCFLGKILDFL